MITYQSARWWQSTWFIFLVMLAGVAGVAWWWSMAQGQGGVAASEPAAQPGPVTASDRPAPKNRLPDAALLVPPTVLGDGRPSDFSPEDWAALNEAVSKTPDPAGELARIVQYLRFQKGFEQWQSLEGSGDVAKRRQLAQLLLDQVPERLKQSEMTYGEAEMLMAAFVADLEPNEARRQVKLDALQAQLQAASLQTDPQQAAREEAQAREYKRREAAIVADFQSRPEGQRNHAKLEQDLDAARRAVWGNKP